MALCNTSIQINKLSSSVLAKMSSLFIIIINFVILFSLCFHQITYALLLSLPYNRGYHHCKCTLVVTVDQSGKGNFTKVQDAVNFAPAYSKHWICIHVRAGIYNEKVNIPQEKPYIVLEGDGRRITVIQFADGGTFLQSSTFSLSASNFVARKITFKNIHDQRRNFMAAPAATISGDKAAFFECGFISVQDTLTDNQGRHYFESCYIQGAVDFIWGDGQSVYRRCTINATYEFTPGSNVGYITAQARHSARSQTGFVFIECAVVGTIGSTYLGRAYTHYSRVLFYKSRLEGLIAHEGWLPWYSSGHVKDVVFAEEGCIGDGSNKWKRVSWERKLSQKEVESLVNVDVFINYDRWLNKLPTPLFM
ncbi:putative pectinesterase 55 [Silene latifolia]|uniref:putative pectinesterase 55 n=1 Tax=Silene latifolia TaxID=37657 RepID=UPI003D76D167